MNFEFLSDEEIQNKKRFMERKISVGNKIGFFFLFLFCALPLVLLALHEKNKLSTFSVWCLVLIPVSFFMLILVFSVVSDWTDSMGKYQIVQDDSSIVQLAEKVAAYPDLRALFCKAFRVRGYLMEGEQEIFWDAIHKRENEEKKLNDKQAVQKILCQLCQNESV